MVAACPLARGIARRGEGRAAAPLAGALPWLREYERTHAEARGARKAKHERATAVMLEEREADVRQREEELQALKLAQPSTEHRRYSTRIRAAGSPAAIGSIC